MSKANTARKRKVFFVITAALSVLICFFAVTGCKSLGSASGPSSYSVDNILVDRENARSELLQGHKDYSGKVLKISPLNGRNWIDNSRVIYWEWGEVEPGPCYITVTMSVMVENENSGKSVISAYKPTEKAATAPSSIKWKGPASIGWTIQNEDTFSAQFGGKAVVVPEGKWVDLTFSESFDLSTIGSGQILLDGHNDHQGLVDLTLYVRNFKVTIRNSLNYVALTFNNGPTDFTGYLLDKLDELNVKGTFFVTGMGIDAVHPVYDRNYAGTARLDAAEERKGVIKRMFDEGHEVANLTYSRNYLGGGRLDGTDNIDTLIQKSSIFPVADYSVTNYPLTEAAIRREIEDTQTAIQKAVYGSDGATNHPVVSKYLRMPFNFDLTKAVNFTSVARNMGLPIIGGVSTRSTDSNKTPDEIVNAILQQIKPWGIVVCDDPRSDSTALTVLDTLIPKLKSEGYFFVTLSQMAEKRVKALNAGEYYDNFDPQH